MNHPRTPHDWLVAITLTAVLHLLIIKTAVLPPGNYFFPFVDDIIAKVEKTGVESAAGPGSSFDPVTREEEAEQSDAHPSEVAAVPYQRGLRQSLLVSGVTQVIAATASLLPLSLVELTSFRSLVRQSQIARLAPPIFSSATIPPKPDKSMGQEVDEDAEAILLGNVFQDAVPATSGFAAMLRAEAEFLRDLREDIGDGRLDMPFAIFILSSEYYQLSRAMMPLGQQPSFTLEEAMSRYKERLHRVGEGMPKKMDAYWLVMLLQRYAENKFYPGNGSGMLLDSLFYLQNDCEAGTKEVLAYLQALYPNLTLGSNRGMLRTTSGELIGHMQVFIGPGQGSGEIFESERGLIVETTRIGQDSVLPYSSGDVFPLEDFVVRYYPELVAGTPLARALSQGADPDMDQLGRIVGTSDHPLKMSYGGSTTLLTEQFYDLANIRSQRIENEFLRSNIPSCNPRIDPARIDRSNLFSNFVAIDRKLRRSLISHYLADLQYWDNQIMPQWREPQFLAAYADLAGSLLALDSAAGGFIQIDAENSVPLSSLQSHARLLKDLRDAAEKNQDPYVTKGRQQCSGRTVLDDKLLRFLFTTPEGPGVFFLPSPGENFHWETFFDRIVNDCLAVPSSEGEHSLLADLEAETSGRQTSLRKELYDRAIVRSLVAATSDHNTLAPLRASLTSLMTGDSLKPMGASNLKKRQSSASTSGAPSVQETVSELGRTGVNTGLLWDIADFLGQHELRSLLRQYAQRIDLRLTVLRAQELVSQLVTHFADADPERLLADMRAAVTDKNLGLALAMHLAKVQGQTPEAVSRLALDYLEGGEVYRAENLVTLLQYGLLPDDALLFLNKRLAGCLDRLPKLNHRQAVATVAEKDFIELVEIIRTLPHLPDRAIRQTLHSGLSSSLFNDFVAATKLEGMEKDIPEWGVVFNKIMLLTLLQEAAGGNNPGLSLAWLKQFIHFAADNPVGKLMLDPVLKVAGDENIATVLRSVYSDQMGVLDRLRQDHGSLYRSQAAITSLLGDGNVMARILLAVDADLVSELSGLPVEQFAARSKYKASWYLETLHRRIGALIDEAGEAKEAALGGTDPLLVFYLDGRVRESFAMLAFLQQNGGGGDGVRFRKTQDLATIKDPKTLRVIEDERRITRQDMSLLTLALNPANPPAEMRRTWEETLAVTDKHLHVQPLDKGLRRYLFAPHYPYLTENDSGFFFSPETIEDLHNAADWGGRNDILLSSYLHFRHLPGQLPDWLVRTAMDRSELELKIIKKFEQQSFLPMILECDSDKKELPDSLFRAKWAIRKPFGEDIFPGTLLLLRLGYLDINAGGDIVRTAKYVGG